MMHTKNTGKSTGNSTGTKDLMYRGSYMVPEQKDWVFRQRTKRDGSPGSQTELRENHPEVTRIWVDKRENSKTTNQGQVLRVEISGPNKEVVEACYQEGRQKILDSLEYDAKKKQQSAERKERYHRDRHFRAEQQILRANGGECASDEIQSGDGALIQSFKMAMKKTKKNSDADAVAEKDNGPTLAQLKSGNGFAALFDEEDEYAKAQAQRNLGKSRRVRMAQGQGKQQRHVPVPVKQQTVAEMFADAPTLPIAPKVVREAPKVSGGWAKMAATPKKVEPVKVISNKTSFVSLAPKTKTVETSSWDNDWSQDQTPIGTGGDVWDDWE